MGQGSQIGSREILATLARELEHAGSMCERVESLVTQLVRANRGENIQVNLFEVQTIDLLIQHIEALAQFAHTLADQGASGEFDVAKAADRIKLAELAERLGAKRVVEHPPASVATSGDLDLF